MIKAKCQLCGETFEANHEASGSELAASQEQRAYSEFLKAHAACRETANKEAKR